MESEVKYKNEPLVSVVVLNYNGLQYLKQTIQPLLNLDYPNFELIIVDNGSIDGSIKFLEQYQNLKLVKNFKNLGYSKGKNVGLREAKGDYILSLDEDILITNSNLLRIMLKNYQEQTGFLQVPLVDRGSEKTFYYGTYYSVYGLNMHRPSLPIQKILTGRIYPISGPTGGFFFISKEHLNRIGLFDEMQPFHIDDVDIGPRAWNFGFKNYLITSTYCEHLGINKTADLDKFIERFRLIFSGHARAMFKNFNLVNLIFRFPVFFMFQLLKAIKFSITRKSSKILSAYLHSVWFFLKNFLDTLKQRRYVQDKRSVYSDIYLKLSPPKF